MKRWMAVVALLAAGVSGAGADERAELARRLEPILARPPATGLLVWEVRADSQAQRAGFQVGDVLTHYDGQAVTTTAQLVDLARAAAREGRSGLLVLVRRGTQELDASFDAAPLGVRLLPVTAGTGRTLWRPESAYEANLDGLERAVGSAHRWELVVHNNEPIGWARSYLVRQGGTLVLRTQSRLREHGLDVKRDTVVRFAADRYLSLRAIRLVSQDKLIIDLVRQGDRLVGTRAGVAVSAALPADCVTAALAGHVAATLPQQQGSCLRASYLGEASLSAAPFADLYCTGPETVTSTGRKVATHRFEQTVFGEPSAEYWVDSKREIVQTRFGNGIEAVRADERTVEKQFPGAGAEFEPIERLPAPGPTPPIGN